MFQPPMPLNPEPPDSSHIHEGQIELELGEGLSEWERDEQATLSDQELSQLRKTTPLRRVLYIVVAIAVLLWLMVFILGVFGVHFW